MDAIVETGDGEPWVAYQWTYLCRLRNAYKIQKLAESAEDADAKELRKANAKELRRKA